METTIRSSRIRKEATKKLSICSKRRRRRKTIRVQLITTPSRMTMSKRIWPRKIRSLWQSARSRRGPDAKNSSPSMLCSVKSCSGTSSDPKKIRRPESLGIRLRMLLSVFGIQERI
uniref:(northern house mosquito) hypothetical protein n=1 Tax=Culex pipiens TaxID=7175 RepID=A0A8D8AFJ2_CULPI